MTSTDSCFQDQIGSLDTVDSRCIECLELLTQADLADSVV